MPSARSLAPAYDVEPFVLAFAHVMHDGGLVIHLTTINLQSRRLLPPGFPADAMDHSEAGYG